MTRDEIRALPDDTLVCHCNGVTLGEIVKAIEAGAKDLESLIDEVGAGDVCEMCQSCEKDEAEEREVHLVEILEAYS